MEIKMLDLVPRFSEVALAVVAGLGESIYQHLPGHLGAMTSQAEHSSG